MVSILTILLLFRISDADNPSSDVSYHFKVSCPSLLILAYLQEICATHWIICLNVNAESSGLLSTVRSELSKVAVSAASETLQQVHASCKISLSVTGYASLLLVYGWSKDSILSKADTVTVSPVSFPGSA